MIPADRCRDPSRPQSPPAARASSGVQLASGARQLQFPAATAGVFIRASEPSSSRSCAGTTAISATLVSVARISGHTGAPRPFRPTLGPRTPQRPCVPPAPAVFHQPCVVSLSCVPV